MTSQPRQAPPPGPEWRVSDAVVPYPEAVAEMEARVADIRAGRAAELVWLLEHPSLYTAGTSARPEELLDATALPVFATGRGGRFTYHGPGQRVAYVMLDLAARGADLRAFVHALEEWAILALARFNLRAARRPGRIGVWVDRRHGGRPGADDKIAAVGVRVRRWVTYHGLALNVDPDLAAYRGIVPCGIPGGPDADHGVTSLTELGIPVSMPEVDAALMETFEAAFARLAARRGAPS